MYHIESEIDKDCAGEHDDDDGNDDDDEGSVSGIDDDC